MRDHLDEFIHQLGELGAYFKAHELWHDDVIPQNVMWSSARHAMKLVDVSAWFPRRYLDHGRELYNDGRTRGVFRRDNTVDTDYVRDVFLQDLAPWVMVMLRKAGFFIKK